MHKIDEGEYKSISDERMYECEKSEVKLLNDEFLKRANTTDNKITKYIINNKDMIKYKLNEFRNKIIESINIKKEKYINIIKEKDVERLKISIKVLFNQFHNKNESKEDLDKFKKKLKELIKTFKNELSYKDMNYDNLSKEFNDEFSLFVKDLSHKTFNNSITEDEIKTNENLFYDNIKEIYEKYNNDLKELSNKISDIELKVDERLLNEENKWKHDYVERVFKELGDVIHSKSHQFKFMIWFNDVILNQKLIENMVMKNISSLLSKIHLRENNKMINEDFDTLIEIEIKIEMIFDKCIKKLKLASQKLNDYEKQMITSTKEKCEDDIEVKNELIQELSDSIVSMSNNKNEKREILINLIEEFLKKEFNQIKEIYCKTETFIKNLKNSVFEFKQSLYNVIQQFEINYFQHKNNEVIKDCDIDQKLKALLNESEFSSDNDVLNIYDNALLEVLEFEKIRLANINDKNELLLKYKNDFNAFINTSIEKILPFINKNNEIFTLESEKLKENFDIINLLNIEMSDNDIHFKNDDEIFIKSLSYIIKDKLSIVMKNFLEIFINDYNEFIKDIVRNRDNKANAKLNELNEEKRQLIEKSKKLKLDLNNFKIRENLEIKKRKELFKTQCNKQQHHMQSLKRNFDIFLRNMHKDLGSFTLNHEKTKLNHCMTIESLNSEMNRIKLKDYVNEFDKIIIESNFQKEINQLVNINDEIKKTFSPQNEKLDEELNNTKSYIDDNIEKLKEMISKRINDLLEEIEINFENNKIDLEFLNDLNITKKECKKIIDEEKRKISLKTKDIQNELNYFQDILNLSTVNNLILYNKFIENEILDDYIKNDCSVKIETDYGNIKRLVLCFVIFDHFHKLLEKFTKEFEISNFSLNTDIIFKFSNLNDINYKYISSNENLNIRNVPNVQKKKDDVNKITTSKKSIDEMNCVEMLEEKKNDMINRCVKYYDIKNNRNSIYQSIPDEIQTIESNINATFSFYHNEIIIHDENIEVIYESII